MLQGLTADSTSSTDESYYEFENTLILSDVSSWNISHTRGAENSQTL
jgi:hypothetical protein